MDITNESNLVLKTYLNTEISVDLPAIKKMSQLNFELIVAITIVKTFFCMWMVVVHGQNGK